MKIESKDVMDVIKWEMAEADRQAAWIADQIQKDAAGSQHCINLGMQTGLNFGKIYLASVEAAIERMIERAKEEEENED